MPLYTVGVLLLKSTLFFAAGLLALRLATRSTAAQRHMICLCAMSLPLLLPVALLTPSRGEVFHISVNAGGAVRVAAVAANRFHGMAWLATIWGVGVALALLRVAVGYRRMAQLRRTATPATFRGSSPVPVLYADVAVPMVSGLARPRILIPRAASEWPAAQMQAALDHELGHIRRRDLHTGLLALIVRAAYWFHPLVWMLAARLREAQEDACDDLVLEAGFAPADYAGALLATARGLTTSSTSLYGCAMTTQTNLKTRIARLLDSGIARTTSTSALRRTAFGFAALLIAVAMLGSARADEVYKAGGDVTAPTITLKVDPEYTADLKAEHVEGKVVLNLVVGADGYARDFTVQESPDPRLSESSIAAVRQWRFAPGMRKGEAVAVMVRIEVNWHLLD